MKRVICCLIFLLVFVVANKYHETENVVKDLYTLYELPKDYNGTKLEVYGNYEYFFTFTFSGFYKSKDKQVILSKIYTGCSYWYYAPVVSLVLEMGKQRWNLTDEKITEIKSIMDIYGTENSFKYGDSIRATYMVSEETLYLYKDISIVDNYLKITKTESLYMGNKKLGKKDFDFYKNILISQLVN